MFSSLSKFRDTIGYLLFKKIFFWYITFVIVFTSFQIYKEYTYSNKLVKKDMQGIEKSFGSIISNAVWHFEEPKINSQVKAIIESKIITGIVILTPLNEVIARKGTITNDFKSFNEYVFSEENNQDVKYYDKLVFHQFEIYDLSNKEKEILGTVTLFVKSNEITEMAKEGIFLIIVNVIISATILWALFIYFANKMLTVPLKELIEATKELRAKEFHQIEISLNTEQKHELNTLAETFNDMSKRINETYINLKQLTIIQDKQKSDLANANKYKTDFLANMSHELKTPLNSINVISSVMMKNKDNTLNEKQVKNLNIINNCGNDLLYLINDVLDISKLEAGEVVIDCTQFNLPSLMLEIKEMFEPQVQQKGLNLVYKCDDKIGDIYSDENRIKQVIKNLLSNALKFIKEGNIDLLIEDDDKYVKIDVIDEGIGIEEEKLEHIFDRFKQADGSTTRQYGGTGLGLAICKELLHLLDGDIKVKSEVNVGTTFTVLIPKNKDKVKEEIKENIVKEETNLEIAKSNKVLVLNNDPVAFMALVIDLKSKFEVVQVTNLNDFVKEFKKDNFDTIIVDSSNQKNEDMNKLINKINKKIIVIYSEELSENIANSVYYTAKKPINKEQILEKVSN